MKQKKVVAMLSLLGALSMFSLTMAWAIAGGATSPSYTVVDVAAVPQNARLIDLRMLSDLEGNFGLSFDGLQINRTGTAGGPAYYLYPKDLRAAFTKAGFTWNESTGTYTKPIPSGILKRSTFPTGAIRVASVRANGDVFEKDLSEIKSGEYTAENATVTVYWAQLWGAMKAKTSA